MVLLILVPEQSSMEIPQQLGNGFAPVKSVPIILPSIRWPLPPNISMPKMPSSGQKLLVVNEKQDKMVMPDLSSLDEKKLRNAERKILEAQREIESIKNKKSELSEAEKAYAQAKKRLEKLKGGKLE